MKTIQLYINKFMKSIKLYIQEGLKITSKTKVNENVLNQNVNNLEELRNIIIDYFPNAKVGEIKNEDNKWYFRKSKEGIIVKKYFVTKFYNSKNKINKKLQFAKYDNVFIMQLIIKDKGKWDQLRIYGLYGSKDEFKIGKNFFDFLMYIKEATDKNDIFAKSKEIVELFGLNAYTKENS